ncbi:hypothetical protein EX30DRAFT_344743 [Ascodesmis nigricans]|uniref:Uncharacterized protein n=1 Tax=Ascodesmis nigricans TaxID=341454 RepID=A0A4S2MIL3_9PEZI|nr:hypothetical protein EX30DRAFT_344743 [Ascodesmis nigricans]
MAQFRLPLCCHPLELLSPAVHFTISILIVAYISRSRLIFHDFGSRARQLRLSVESLKSHHPEISLFFTRELIG